MSTMPISTLILSHFFLDDENMTKKKLIGFLDCIYWNNYFNNAGQKYN